ncbi:phage tail tape measure protein, partial [Methanohalobium sp.]|uniref:phage tail tape measure protein n=1 Tax=Methanohalobium sp. TaxID=2837493 RepID=UPI0025D576DE
MASLSKLKTEVFDFAKKFEQAMTEVRTISKEVDRNFEQWSQRITDLSTEVPDNANKLAKGLYEVSSAGYEGAEGLNVLETASKTAAAGMTDTKTAASMLTATMNAYNMEADRATEVADSLFATVSGGMLKMEGLSGQFGEVAAAASAMDISVEEALAAVQ